MRSVYCWEEGTFLWRYSCTSLQRRQRTFSSGLAYSSGFHRLYQLRGNPRLSRKVTDSQLALMEKSAYLCQLPFLRNSKYADFTHFIFARLPMGRSQWQAHIFENIAKLRFYRAVDVIKHKHLSNDLTARDVVCKHCMSYVTVASLSHAICPCQCHVYSVNYVNFKRCYSIVIILWVCHYERPLYHCSLVQL